MKTHKSNTQTLLKQIKIDLFTKDSQIGYTYIWMANQIGHFALGFMIVMLGFWIFFPNDTIPFGNNMCIAISCIAIWTIFELANFANALYHTRNNSFKPNWLYIANDTIVDLCFFYYGIIVAYLGHFNPKWGLVSFFSIFILLLPSSYYWLIRKMYYQRAGYPDMLSLSEFNKTFQADVAQNIMNFAYNKGEWKHILIFGDKEKNKSDLAVSIGVEFAIHKGVSCYTTFSKWAQQLQLLNNYNPFYWHWRNSSILVIDDVSISVKGLLDNEPEHIVEMINSSLYPKENLKALRKLKTIWVLGAELNKQKWLEMLYDLKMIENHNQVGLICIEDNGATISETVSQYLITAENEMPILAN